MSHPPSYLHHSSGRHRLASALGASLLAGCLALAGCSSNGSKAGGTIPPVSSAGAGSGSATSSDASGGASADASSTASSGPVTAESLSDPDLGYTVVSIPEGLDATQTKVLQDYIDYDKATWKVWFTREGLDEALARSTGTTQEAIQRTFDSMTDHDNPPVSVGVDDIELSEDRKSADVTTCLDKTKMTTTDFQGNDVTQKSNQGRLKVLIHMVPNGDGLWVAESETKLSANECTTEAGQ